MRAAWRRPLAVALCFAAFLPAPGPRTEGALAEDQRDASGPLSGGPDSGGSGERTGRAWSYTAVAWGGGVRPLVSSSHLPTRHNHCHSQFNRLKPSYGVSRGHGWMWELGSKES